MIRLPRRVDVKGIIYKVVQLPSSDPRLEGWLGTVDWDRCEILLDKKQTLQIKWMVLWHEVIHIIVAGCNDMHAEDEALVDIIGVEIFSICRQLGFLEDGRKNG